MCPLLEKYGTFIERCNALIKKVSPCIQRRKLFQNIGAVCGFAFVGTLVSTFVIAMTMYAAGGWAPAVPDGAAQGEGMVSGVAFSLFVQLFEKDGTLIEREYGTDRESATLQSVLESLVFGSLISATDPVTVLAIFGKLGADRDLYALVRTCPSVRVLRAKKITARICVYPGFRRERAQ
eukprot:SAG31_NODE_1923_length_6914_cov_3.243580_3_plen_179_part_00